MRVPLTKVSVVFLDYYCRRIERSPCVARFFNFCETFYILDVPRT